MSRLDPRAQLAWLVAIVLGVILGGDEGLLLGAGIALLIVARTAAGPAYGRLVVSLLPLVVALVVFDALAGQPGSGVRVAGRLLVRRASASASRAWPRPRPWWPDFAPCTRRIRWCSCSW